MLPLGIFKSRQFTISNLLTFVVYAALSGVLFLLAVDLQQVLGYSALAAGASLLPITIIMLLLSARAGQLSQRIGPRLPMTLGPLIIAVGLVAHVADRRRQLLSATAMLPALVVFSLGLALTVAPLTTTVLGAVDARPVRHRLGGEQRRGPDRRPPGRGPAPAAGRPDRCGLPRAGAVSPPASTRPS